ncbi:MAG TPA: PilX N-terminal domain-containing pilus assembly protein [Burkholderiaceae bacterium]|jgi:type IV pilus assembly protein PilX|nr:PilX N-terminal domain-containing pilus assembly protein [Burkholderiaceae bacterium]
MSHLALRRPRVARRLQSGAVLVVGLIFLALLTLIGATAFTIAQQNERMSGNTRDTIRAFEAAEAALRDCESVLASSAGLPAFGGSGGMYTARAYDVAPQLFEDRDWSDASQVRVLAAPLVDVSQQPRCIVERLGDILVTVQGGAVSMGQKKEPQTVYRITAVGFGANANTVARVQSTYRRP